MSLDYRKKVILFLHFTWGGDKTKLEEMTDHALEHLFKIAVRGMRFDRQIEGTDS